MDEKKSADLKIGQTRAASDTRAHGADRQPGKIARGAVPGPGQKYREYRLKMISAAHANVDAMFEYAEAALRAQSVSELIELSAAHSRRQLENMAEQTREMAMAAQKFASEAARPS